MTRIYGINWDELPLGEMPDQVLADKIGAKRSTVKRRRQERNIKSFDGKYETQEGFICKSLYEAKYDAFLHSQNISHEHEVLVSETGYIADFLIENTYIEIEGMVGFDRYDNRNNKKKIGYKKHKINVNWIQPEDVNKLYLDCGISLKYRNILPCEMCGKENPDLVLGVCRGACYMKKIRELNKIKRVCQCGKTFNTTAFDDNNFCSLECYWESMRHEINIDYVIQEVNNGRSLRSVANEMDIYYNTLVKRARKYGWQGRKGFAELTT